MVGVRADDADPHRAVLTLKDACAGPIRATRAEYIHGYVDVT